MLTSEFALQSKKCCKDTCALPGESSWRQAIPIPASVESDQNTRRKCEWQSRAKAHSSPQKEKCKIFEVSAKRIDRW